MGGAGARRKDYMVGQEAREKVNARIALFITTCS
jgi:hypothetical protein